MSSKASQNTELQILGVATGLLPEICSYLDVHDQVNMKSVCKWWRMNLTGTLLSKLVDMDVSRMPSQSKTPLEHALKKHVQKNTRILVIRHMASRERYTFGIIARVIKEKHADLLQLTLKDCEVQRECSEAAYYWTHPERILSRMVHGLIFVTKKLVLENYTIRSVLSGAVWWFDATMPCSIPREQRRNRFSQVPAVLPRCEFDCTKPLQQLYYTFIMALNSNCPEVCPETRDAVVQLYKSWIHCDAHERQWLTLGNVIKCLNEGVAVTFEDGHVDVSALRQLDPLALNNVTIQALHRLYF